MYVYSSCGRWCAIVQGHIADCCEHNMKCKGTAHSEEHRQHIIIKCIKPHALEAYGRVEVSLHAFLTLPIRDGAWSASLSSRFNSTPSIRNEWALQCVYFISARQQMWNFHFVMQCEVLSFYYWHFVSSWIDSGVCDGCIGPDSEVLSVMRHVSWCMRAAPTLIGLT